MHPHEVADCLSKVDEFRLSAEVLSCTALSQNDGYAHPASALHEA